jgi:hypothetical protein
MFFSSSRANSERAAGQQSVPLSLFALHPLHPRSVFKYPNFHAPAFPLRYRPCCIAHLSRVEQFAAMSTSANGPLSLATLNPKVVFKASAQFCFVASQRIPQSA